MGFSIGSILPAVAAGAGFMVGGPVGAALVAGGARDIASQQNLFQTSANQNAMNFSAAQAMQQQEFQTQQVKEQRDYETKMANTTYQRGAEDMRKAGINPILLSRQPGDPTPSTASPSGAKGEGVTSSGTKPEYKSPTLTGLTTALSVASAIAQIRKTNAETYNLKQNAKVLHTKASVVGPFGEGMDWLTSAYHNWLNGPKDNLVDTLDKMKKYIDKTNSFFNDFILNSRTQDKVRIKP
jgi:hypothetical protein